MDDAVRGYLTDLLNLRMVKPILRPGSGALLRFLTAGFLAPAFRDALQVDWSPRQQSWFERLFVRQGGSEVLLADIRRRVWCW